MVCDHDTSAAVACCSYKHTTFRKLAEIGMLQTSQKSFAQGCCGIKPETEMKDFILLPSHSSLPLPNLNLHAFMGTFKKLPAISLPHALKNQLANYLISVWFYKPTSTRKHHHLGELFISWNKWRIQTVYRNNSYFI